MQISPSANLFRALGGLAQTPAASPARPVAEQAQQMPRPTDRRPLHEMPQLAASTAPAAPPAANLPRGSLINLKV